ncbi:hypothetical protein FKP32DRAFT_1607007 [Trametes sanguinea]|nr:hypothetical protein FKP32DRAFT_1607007 [Trametes sanguinea]
MTAASRDKQQQLQEELANWYEGVQQFASQLSERYGRKPDHYMHLLFSGGAKMQKERKPNAYNAWSSAIAKEANEEAEPGVAQRLVSLQQEKLDEYHALTDAEKAQLLYGLKNRVGVEAFVCVVRNNTEFHAPPFWYFTDLRLDRFLRGRIRGWDCVTIASLSEAFSVAGCDFALGDATAYYSTSKEKADYYKREIRDRIRDMLSVATGNEKAVMNYVSHEKDIAIRYGVELIGYTTPFVNPSSLTSSLPTLRNLLAAIEDGSCHFRRIPPAELQKRTKEYDEKVKSGAIAPRKVRSDAGKTHAKRLPVRADGNGDKDIETDPGNADEHPSGPVAGPSNQDPLGDDHDSNAAVQRKRGRPRKQQPPPSGSHGEGGGGEGKPSRPAKRARKNPRTQTK